MHYFITMSETQTYHHDPKLKQEHLKWTEAGCASQPENDSQKVYGAC